MMNILFDINHPAHVHLFRNVIRLLSGEGHHILITARDKDVTIQLLEKYRLPYRSLSRARSGLAGLAFELIERQLKLFPILLSHKIQVCVTATGACTVHVSGLLRIPCLVFYDTEHATLQNALTIPFATRFITPRSFEANAGRHHLTYNGFHDLAYLHPSYFQPDASVLSAMGTGPEEKFIIMRFVSWKAAHDIGQKGISLELKRRIVQLSSQYAKIFISAESPLPAEFEQYRLAIPPDKLHDALSFAALYVGEGGSMATESAVLGTPAIFISSLTAGVFKELENTYALMYSFHPEQSEEILDKIKNLLASPDTKPSWQAKRQRLIRETVDLTQWMRDVILEYGKKRPGRKNKR